MACISRIIHRGENIGDESVSNKWRWEWVGKGIEGESLSDHIRKIDIDGTARCMLCSVDIVYAHRGLTALKDHLKCAKHVKKRLALKNTTTLPGAALPKSRPYGLDPVLVKSEPLPKSSTKLEPLVPVMNRVLNLEALTLAFAVEHNQSLSMVPELISFAKVLAADPEALDSLKMDRTTASYKLRHGLAKAVRGDFLQELKTSQFSLNIDEATADTNVKVLKVLSSHFSTSANKIVVHHLASIQLVKVTAEALHSELQRIFTELDLKWTNLVSVLMDSCRVMRGSKKGLETLIRKDAPQLLDIDGDSCHHAHNAAKHFCQPFDSHVESVFSDIHTDFRWSSEQKDILYDICRLIGVKPTCPERYIAHRWLSVLDCTLDTLRLMDALVLFYFSFMTEVDKGIYKGVVEAILERRGVSEEGRAALAKLQNLLCKRTLTNDGKENCPFSFFLSPFICGIALSGGNHEFD